MAQDYVLEALAATRANRIGVHEAVAEGNLAWLSLGQGKYDEAYQHGQAAIELWRQSPADAASACWQQAVDVARWL